jgi:hypothetical protein
VRNLDVDKAGAADSLTGAVMVMVIIVVERMKRSRREKLDRGQLKWAVDKSKRNVKAVSRHAPSEGGGGKSRARTQRGRDDFPAQLEQRFNKHFHLQYVTDYVQGTQDKVSIARARRALGLSILLGASVCHPSPRIRVSTVRLEAGREASQ